MSVPSDSTTQPSTTPTTNQLPAEAIELATKLFGFARNGDTSALEQYLTAGIPPNLTNSKGDTLLMLAAYHGHAELVKLLLSKGADPNALNDRGQSPLAGAVFKGYSDVVRALWDGGAKGDLGQPSAIDSARLFKRDEYLQLFGAEDADLGFARPNGPPGI